MADTKNMSVQGNNPKHIRSFWPIVIIVSIAVILSGVIWYFAQNNIVQDEVDSSVFSPTHYLKKTTVKKPVKMVKPQIIKTPVAK